MALLLGKRLAVPTIREEYKWPMPSKTTQLRTFFLSLEWPQGVFLEFEEETRAEQNQPGGLIPKMLVELSDERPLLEKDLEGKGVTTEEGDDGGASDFSSTRT